MFEFFKRKKKMGGENESLMKKDKGTPAAAAAVPVMVLHPDKPPAAPANTVEAMRLADSYGNVTTHYPTIPAQTQTIRQHMNAGQVHLHCDEQQLKAAVPVAEWYIIMRQLRSLIPFTWLDADNKCVAYFRPYINAGLFEVTVELAPINIGNRFADMNAVTGKR